MVLESPLSIPHCIKRVDKKEGQQQRQHFFLALLLTKAFRKAVKSD